MSDMENWTLSNYLERLASKDPAPGGGAVAGVTAAQAAGLLAMVGRISQGPGVEAKAQVAASACASILELAREDGAAFQKVMAAFSLPRETGEEREHRAAAIDDALKGACKVPIKLMREVRRLWEHADVLVRHGKKSIISDAAIAVILIDASLRASAYNVRINLSLIKDSEFVSRTRAEMRDLMGADADRQAQLLAKIDDLLD